MGSAGPSVTAAVAIQRTFRIFRLRDRERAAEEYFWGGPLADAAHRECWAAYTQGPPDLATESGAGAFLVAYHKDRVENF